MHLFEQKCVTNKIFCFKTTGGSAPDSYPYGSKRSRSLEKRGSKSLDSANDGKEVEPTRRMSTIGSLSGTTGCNIANGEYNYSLKAVQTHTVIALLLKFNK